MPSVRIAIAFTDGVPLNLHTLGRTTSPSVACIADNENSPATVVRGLTDGEFLQNNDFENVLFGYGRVGQRKRKKRVAICICVEMTVDDKNRRDGVMSLFCPGCRTVFQNKTDTRLVLALPLCGKNPTLSSPRNNNLATDNAERMWK